MAASDTDLTILANRFGNTRLVGYVTNSQNDRRSRLASTFHVADGAFHPEVLESEIFSDKGCSAFDPEVLECTRDRWVECFGCQTERLTKLDPTEPLKAH
jgi:hypothetical protein